MAATDDLTAATARAQRPHRLGDLHEFLALLRDQLGFEIGVGEEARLIYLLDALRAREVGLDDPEAVEAWLAPVVCTNKREQELFGKRFRAWVAAHPVDAAPLTSSERLVQVEPERERRSRWWLAALIVGIFLAGWGLWIFWPAGVDPMPERLQSPAFVPDLVSRLQLACLPLLLLALWLTGRRQRGMELARQFTLRKPESRTVFFQAAEGRLFDSVRVRGPLQALRRRRVVSSSDLDVAQSVHATVRAGGRVQLRFAQRQQLATYLLLVDRRSKRDHLPAIADLITARMRDEDVQVTRFDFHADPRRAIRREKTNAMGPVVELGDLAAIHGDNVLLLLATSERLFRPASREPQPWISKLLAWREAVLLTPVPVASWGWRERELAALGFVVLPATCEGIETLSALFTADELAEPNSPLRTGIEEDLAERLARRPDPVLQNDPPAEIEQARLLAGLEKLLAANAFRLLCALAVFPELHQELTLYMGAVLRHPGDESKPLLDEAGLGALARLPWLRQGYLPDWLRSQLVEQIPSAERKLVRDAYQAFLLTAKEAGDPRLALEVARRSGSAWGERLLDLIRGSEGEALRDALFVSFMFGREPGKLAVEAGKSLPHLLRRPWPWSERLAGGAAGAAALLLWWVHPALVQWWHAIEPWLLRGAMVLLLVAVAFWLRAALRQMAPTGLGEPDGRTPKAIVVLSDGTGNSAAKMFGTNVWRLFQALDTSEPTPTARAQGARQQIAYYDDGVGTSSFRPLALLGGVFGWGLKRNVLDLYTFLCRNYKEGDEIYAFGFSRGAFTIRILVGLLTKEGLLSCTPARTEEELARYAPDAYRAYRRDLTKRHRSKRQFNPWRLHVFLLRMVRDKAIGAWRWLGGQKAYDEIGKKKLDTIAFVGVWDTVAAYGTPFAELTHGIDSWVWPLSMPDRKLSKKVKKACHALALDDERDTFHPVLWSEIEEQSLFNKGEVSDGRLQQVWFAGAHSDVGGGYFEDGLAHVALEWMMQEAEAAGLRFDAHRADHLARDCNALGPLHDSRRGLGGYYRYQPRRIGALLEPPDPATLSMRNPDLKGHGLLREVKIHQSVIDCIRSGPDHYAPIVLPATYQVVGWDGIIVPSPESTAAARARVVGQAAVWNEVWKKRVFYFVTVGASLVLAALPLIHAIWPPSACVGPQCLLTPVIAGAGDFLPGFVAPWITAFARTPGSFLGLAVGIAVLLAMGAKWQRHVQDGMRQLWAQSLVLPHPTGAATASARGRWISRSIYRLRTNQAYQGFFQFLKWKLAPNVFGTTVLAGLGLLIFALVLRIPALVARVSQVIAHLYEVGFSQ